MYEITCYYDQNLTKLVEEFIQWDVGQTIYFEDEGFVNDPMVHFFNKSSDLAIERLAVKNGNSYSVDVPNILLQDNLMIFIAIYDREVIAGENEVVNKGNTAYIARIAVHSRPKPEGYINEETISGIDLNAMQLDIKALQEEFDKYETRISDLESADKNLDEKISSIDDLYAKHDSQQSEIDNLTTKANSTQALLNSYTAMVDTNTKDISSIKNSLGDLHTHTNKDAIDSITVENIEKWNSAGDGSISVDETLTESGSAADAAIVGDKVSELQENINTNTESISSLDTRVSTNYTNIGTLHTELEDTRERLIRNVCYTTAITLDNFCQDCFEKSEETATWLVAFKGKFTSDWTPASEDTWMRGLFMIQNPNYDYAEVGTIFLVCSAGFFMGAVTATDSTPVITWEKITTTII